MRWLREGDSMKRAFMTTASAAVLALAFGSGAIAAPTYGAPTGWTGQGGDQSYGTNTANGVVGEIPGQPAGSSYYFVSTVTGTEGVGSLPGVGGTGEPTNGATLTSPLFTANANEALAFYFNYVTSDGAGYADYGWARLLNADGTVAALLFTARTVPSPGNIVPGTDMPLPEATLSPPVVSILEGTEWDSLAGDSGACWDSGCGHSGWVQSSFVITTAGDYRIQFGVTNWDDESFQSGLAFGGVTINDKPIDPPVGVAEPATLALLGMGLLGLGAVRRHRAA